MPATGRALNLKSELYGLSNEELWKTFYVSPSNNICFFGKCKKYCNDKYSICGSINGTIEGSLVAFFPTAENAQRQVCIIMKTSTFFSISKLLDEKKSLETST
jgi:hypothetical protein